MKKLILQLLQKLACCHEWEVHKLIRTFEDSTKERPYLITEVLICKKCGKIKKIKL